MRGKRVSQIGKRALAFVLALAMSLSVFSEVSLVSEASTSTTLEYTGREDGNALFIEEWAFTQTFPFSQENVKAILDSKTVTYESIYIQFPNKTTTLISADLWNAAVAKLDSSNADRYLQIAYIGSDSYNMDWAFYAPETTASDVTVSAAIQLGSALTVNFASTTFPAQSAGLNLNTDSQTSDYASFTSIFGTNEMNLEHKDGNGNVIDTDARYTVGSWYDSSNDVTVYSSHVQFGKIHELTANTTYTLQEEIYKGRIDTYPNGERTVSRLVIEPNEAGKSSTGFTEQEILDILAMHSGKKYDEIYVQQPLTEDVIYSSVVNTALTYLYDTAPYLEFAFIDPVTGESVRWELENPTSMSKDQTVSCKITYDSTGNTASITIGDTSEMNADRVGIAYYVNNDLAVAQNLRTALGSDQINIEAVNTSVNGNYGVDEYNTYFHLSDVRSLTSGTAYTLAKLKYMGQESVWENGITNLTINYNDLICNGESFDDSTLSNILQTKVKEGKIFNRVYIHAEPGTSSLSETVWNSVKALVKTNLSENEWANFQLNIEKENEPDISWEFENLQNASGSVAFAVDTTWSSDGSGLKVSFPSVDYPAAEVKVYFNGDKDETAGDTIKNALGTEKIQLEIVDASENVLNASGYYDGGVDNDRYQLNISNVKDLTAQTTYTIRQKTYRGEEFYEDNGYSEFRIASWGFNGTAQKMDESAISAILDQKIQEGKKFSRVSLIYPEGETRSVSADIWNKARQLLIAKEDQTNNQNSSFFFDYPTEDSYETKWVMNWPSEAAAGSSIVLDSTFVFKAEEGVEVSCSNTNIPAEFVFVELSADSSNAAAVALFEGVFGTETTELELEDADGNLLNGSGGNYYVYNWDNGQGKTCHINFNNINNFTAGNTYMLQKRIYRGTVFENTNMRELVINAAHAGVGNAALTPEQIIDVLKQYEESTFDQISIVQPLSNVNVAAKTVVEEAMKYLKPDGRQVIWFNFIEPNTDDSIIWSFQKPTAITQDLELSWDFRIENGEILVTLDSYSELTAEFVSWQIVTDYNGTIGTALRQILGERNTDLEISNTSLTGNYYVSNDTVNIQLPADKLTEGTQYILTRDAEQHVEEILAVGTTYDWNQRLSNTPMGKVTWTSLDERLASIDANGMLTPVNEGTFKVQATYKANGETVTEIWICDAEVMLTGIAFDRAKIDMEYISGTDNTEWLNIKTYPANAGIDMSALVWSSETTDGNVTVTFGDYGEFSVEGIGTAIVTAALPGTDFKASCTVNVTKMPEFPAVEFAEMVIVTNFAKTLGEVKLPSADFQWKDKKIKLQDYVGLPEAAFPVLYTSNGKTVEQNVILPILTITGIELYTADGERYYQSGAGNVGLEYRVLLEGGSWEDYKNHEAFSSVTLKATGMIEAGQPNANNSLPDSYVFLNEEGMKAGKKTVKLDLLNNNKKVTGTSCMFQITKEEPFDFQKAELSETPVLDTATGTWKYQLTFTEPSLYCKTTIKSTDTSVLKLGKIVYPKDSEVRDKAAKNEPIVIDIPFTELKPGKVGILISMSNEMKSQKMIYHEVKDHTPKVLEDSFMINTFTEEKWTPVTIQYADNYGADKTAAVTVNHSDFVFVPKADSDAGAGRLEGFLQVAPGKEVKKGTYTLKLQIPIELPAEEQDLTDEKVQEVTVKVKVAETKPKLTVKQTEKVNLFYKQDWNGKLEMQEGAGVLTVSSKDRWEEVQILGWTGSGFNLFPLEDGTYMILANASNGSLESTIKVDFWIKNWKYDTEVLNYTQTIKIRTLNKAPAIAMSQKTDTLYPGYGFSKVSFTEKTTGKELSLSNVSWLKSKSETVTILSDLVQEANLNTGKCQYTVKAGFDAANEVTFELTEASNAADTFKLRIQDENWNGTVDVSYKITSKLTAPKVKLSSNKLVLNSNAEVSRSQVSGTVFSFDGYNAKELQSLQVSFTGADKKSKAALNQQIALSCDGNQIIAKLNHNPAKPEELPSGTYKFKVWVRADYFETSTVLTISVVNSSVSKSVKLSKSGTIDVLRRESYITFKPKLTNLSGSLVDAYVLGTNGGLFRAEVDAKGNLKLFADAQAQLSTAVNYKIQLQLILQNADGSRYSIVTPEQSIKVTQGKVKVTLTPVDGTVLYTQAGGSLTANLTAGVKNSDLCASNVTFAKDYEGLLLEFDEASQTIQIKCDGMLGVANFRKTLSLKLNVEFREQAVNAKAVQVVYKMKVQ